MIESSIKSAWWLWWVNPLVQMHPDQKKRLLMSAPGAERLDYSEVGTLRATLNLATIPEDGVIAAPFYGALVMLEPGELLESKHTLTSLTFSEDVFKFSLSEWSKQFDVKDKEYIRALISFSRSAPEELEPFLKILKNACSKQHSINILTLNERMQIILSVFFAHKLPALSLRWLWNLSDVVLYVVQEIEGSDSDLIQKFCDYIEPELQSLIELVNQKYTIPQIDFKTLADFESEQI